jgi:(1->4)-alpha-D-glucan 1-alpha-D-glucosylmutase
VDYALRAKLLGELKTISAAQVMERMSDVSDVGAPKLWVVKQALQVRGEHPEWFGAKAAYAAVLAKGPESERVIAYQRGKDVVVVATRWTQGAKDWGETAVRIPAGSWRNRLTGEVVGGGAVKMAGLLSGFPVALLTREA